MQYLSPIDAAFLRMESKRTPMHVGAMMTFKLPDGAEPDFVQKLMLRMRERPFMPMPFGSRLARGRLARLTPAWEDTPVEMDYHLRHSALPYPGGERELGQLVARLHSHPLDLSRPLWECHLIEGLEPAIDPLSGKPVGGRRFVLYFKAHHCAIDGVGAVRMVQHWLSTDPENRDTPGPWMLASKPAKPDSVTAGLLERFRRPVRAAINQARGTRELAVALTKMMQGEDSSARAVLGIPRSRFNTPVSQQRRLGTQILDLARVKAVAAAGGATANDAMLAIVGGAIRRYLLEQQSLPEKSLLASVPVAIKRKDGAIGNAAAGFVVPMGTQLDDPRERLQLIRRVTVRGKKDLGEMSSESQMQFALLGITPLMLGQMTGLLPKMPPLFNIVVSNVVLSKQPLYLARAELEAMYPVSFLFDGYALNVTLVGYVDRIAVGFLGCRDAIPHLQKLAVYTKEALLELEQAFGLAPTLKPTPSPGKKAAARKAASRSK